MILYDEYDLKLRVHFSVSSRIKMVRARTLIVKKLKEMWAKHLSVNSSFWTDNALLFFTWYLVD